MTTTIQISDETKQVLTSLKTKDRKTYDDIIRDLINEKELTKQSMFGKHKTLKWNKKEDRLSFDNE